MSRRRASNKRRARARAHVNAHPSTSGATSPSQVPDASVATGLHASAVATDQTMPPPAPMEAAQHPAAKRRDGAARTPRHRERDRFDEALIRDRLRIARNEGEQWASSSLRLVGLALKDVPADPSPALAKFALWPMSAYTDLTPATRQVVLRWLLDNAGLERSLDGKHG